MRIGRALALGGIALLAACQVQDTRPISTPSPPSTPRAPDRTDGTAFALQGALTQGGYALGQAPEGAVSVNLDGRPVATDPTGRFAIGFGRDAAPSATLTAVLGDGSRVIAHIPVIQRSYAVQSIPGLPPTPSNDPEWLKRRAVERARIDAAKAQRNLSDGWRQQWIWPAVGPISGVYGSQRILGGVLQSPHYGVDVAAPAGTPVVAPADGVVVLAGPPQLSLEGNLVMIDHGMGLISAFLHLSAVAVKTGERVAQGQHIGAVGSSGRATGPHLHWGLSWLDQRLDAALLAGATPPSRSLPAASGAANADHERFNSQ